MHGDSTPLSNRLDAETVRTVTKTVFGVAALVFVAYLVTLLPGIERIVPWTPVSFAALVGAVVTVAIVGLLLYVAPRVATLTRRSLSGPTTVVENAASVVFWLFVLAAVLVAHGGLAAAVVPVLEEATWVYDLLFLLAALPPLIAIAGYLYASLEPSTDLVVDRVVGTPSDDSDEADRNETATQSGSVPDSETP